MTDVSPIPSSQPTSTLSSSTNTTSVARSALTEDLDTFLTLLTKQLQNQDPLQPMDTNQFVDQLTQFSELEQGVEQNETLNDIAASLGAGDRQAEISYLGRVVEAETSQVALTSEGTASFAYEISSPTENAEMRIFNPSGALVAKFDVIGDAGRYSYSWNGETLSGGQAQAGVYQAQVVAKNEDPANERLAGKILSGGTVREVRFDGGQTELILDEGLTITGDSVRRVALPAA
ncbi:MAG: flagellar hook capping FlgD N-terminal domain-containing protein [Pseudomonadota bacterium]